MTCMMNFVLLFNGRSLSTWKEDTYCWRGHIFEICSRSIGKYVFPELINGDGIEDEVDGELLIRRKKYDFKEIMERYMLNGAIKVIERRNGNHTEICWVMARWFNFMDLMGYKEDEHNEQCTVVFIKKLNCDIESCNE